MINSVRTQHRPRLLRREAFKDVSLGLRGAVETASSRLAAREPVTEIKVLDLYRISPKIQLNYKMESCMDYTAQLSGMAP